MLMKPSLLASRLILVCVLALLLTIPRANASTPTTWNVTYGGSGSDLAYAVVKTSDGGYAIVGTTTSSGSGIISAWLVKTDDSGAIQWNMTYNVLGASVATSIVKTNDGRFAITGYTYTWNFSTGEINETSGINVWLAETDSSGTLKWNMTYPQFGYGIPGSVIQTNDGGYALAGSSSSGGSAVYGWLLKTHSDGSLEWNQTYYAGSGQDQLYALVQTGDGGYALAGYTTSLGSGGNDFWLMKTDSSGKMLWNKTYGGSGDEILNSLIKTDDGGYALAGSTNSFGAVKDAFWLVKTDSSGNLQWNETYGELGYADATSIIQTSDSGYVLAGVTNTSGTGIFNGWLVKTDSEGNMQWNQTYGGTGENIFTSVIQANDGGYVLAGYTNSSGAGNYDFWIVKTDSSGVAPKNSNVPDFPGSATTSPAVTLTPPATSGTPTIAPTIAPTSVPSSAPTDNSAYYIAIAAVVVVVVIAAIVLVLRKRK